MSKNISVLNSRTILYISGFFCLFMFSIPREFWLFDFVSFDFYSYRLKQSLVTALVIFLLSVVLAVVMQSLVSGNNEMVVACAVFFVVDPLFKCMLLSVEHIVLLTISIVLCFYFLSGKSFVIKTALVAVFIISSTIINIESAFCYVPLVGLVYSSCWLQEKEKQTNPVAGKRSNRKNHKKNKSSNSKGLRFLNTAALLIIILFVISIYIENVFAKTGVTQNELVYYRYDAYYFVKEPCFWVSLLPYAAGMIIFIREYLLAKSNGKTLTIRALDKQHFLWLIALSYCLILVGAFVFNYASSITMLNMISVVIILLLKSLGPQCAEKAFVSIMNFLKGHKFSFYVIFIVWFCVVQYLFRDVQYSVIDDIINVAGETL